MATINVTVEIKLKGKEPFTLTEQEAEELYNALKLALGKRDTLTTPPSYPYGPPHRITWVDTSGAMST